MTQSQDPPMDPTTDPAKMADLQRQLDDANAQVARVQAELNTAQGSPAPTSSPTITVNGQVIHTGDGHELHQIVDAFRTAHASGQGVTPIVVVNGQPVGTGQPFDLSQYLNPQQLAKVQSALGQLTQSHPEFGQQLQQAFQAGTTNVVGGVPYGGAAMPGIFSSVGAPAPPTTYPSPTSVSPLADPPRHVPFAYKVATFNLSALELFVLVIGFAAPIALWIMLPYAGLVGLVLASALVIAYRVHLYRGRISMLKWGKVATVTAVELAGAGSYYGGTTYQNMRMRQAHGWQAETSFYSGPGYRNKISYTVDGVAGAMTLHGRDYAGGVVLANSKHPDRAMCVSGFPYDVTPTQDGQWPGRLSAWLWGGIVSTLAIELAVLYVTVLTLYRHWS